MCMPNNCTQEDIYEIISLGKINFLDKMKIHLFNKSPFPFLSIETDSRRVEFIEAKRKLHSDKNS